MVETLRIEKANLPPEGASVRVVAGGKPVAVFRVGGALYAIDALCPHVRGPLDQGKVEGTQVTCPWHSSVFDVRDGKLIHGPATHGVTPYRAHLDGDTLVLERD
jgi:nitrite reductase/ring-hydroxylating ferredoxin subunit